LSKFQLDMMVNKTGIFILPKQHKSEK